MTTSQDVSDIRISDLLIEGPGDGDLRNAILLEPESGRIRHVVIERSVIRGFRGDSDGVHVGTSALGSGARGVEDLTISATRFVDTTFPVELVSSTSGLRFARVTVQDCTFERVDAGVTVFTSADASDNVFEALTISGSRFVQSRTGVNVGLGGSRDRVSRTTVRGSRFIGGGQAIRVLAGLGEGRPATGNLIEGIELTANVFQGHEGAAVNISGGERESRDNVVRGIQIANNVFSDNATGILMNGGRDAATANAVGSIDIAFVTAASNRGTAVVVSPNVRAAGNTVGRVAIVNSVLWHNGNDLLGLAAEQVTFTLTTQAGFVGGTNIAADPAFLRPDAGDFRLTSRSPAIGRASASPIRSDLEGRVRPASGADLGAYQSTQ